MIYLSGAVRKDLYGQDGFGFMLQPGMGNMLPRHEIWAADTGCFSNPASYDERRYFTWLKRRNPDTCLFATAPDVVGDAQRTIARSIGPLTMLRGMGFSPALVAQDGLENHPIPWESFDCLFLGGTTEWKLGRHAANIGREALSRGKWLHMGRVNSWSRALAAHWRGCHSVDGTYLIFGPDVNLPAVRGWMRWLQSQQSFF